MHIKVPPVLVSARNVNAYTAQGEVLKKAMHAQGLALLKKLAQELSPALGAYTIRSNVAGMAVSGEVTLHAEHLYVQLSESATGQGGLSLLYRSCKGQKDCCGHQNHWAGLLEFSLAEKQEGILASMRRLIAAERHRKELQAAAVAA